MAYLMAGSSSGVFVGNKPVVRVSAVPAKRPVAQPSPGQQAYHMIQIGDEIFKVSMHVKCNFHFPPSQKFFLAICDKFTFAVGSRFVN